MPAPFFWCVGLAQTYSYGPVMPIASASEKKEDSWLCATVLHECI